MKTSKQDFSQNSQFNQFNLLFIKLEKLHFSHLLGPFNPKTTEYIFQNILALSLFKLDVAITSCKKSENF